jgi:hypothetical protein
VATPAGRERRPRLSLQDDDLLCQFRSIAIFALTAATRLRISKSEPERVLQAGVTFDIKRAVFR